jgi:hypothetical protein
MVNGGRELTLHVRGDVKRDNGEIDNTEVLGTINLEVGVNDTTILFGQHRATADSV